MAYSSTSSCVVKQEAKPATIDIIRPLNTNLFVADITMGNITCKYRDCFAVACDMLSHYIAHTFVFHHHLAVMLNMRDSLAQGTCHVMVSSMEICIFMLS